MDGDLIDLISAWRGGEVELSRREQLLERLRRDEDFLQAFVDEVRMLGMLKAVQSAEPRWLALHEQLGWGAPESATEEDRESELMGWVHNVLHRRGPRIGRLRAVAAVATAAAFIVAIAAFAWPRRWREVVTPIERNLVLTPGNGVAVLLKLEGVEWESRPTPAPSPGTILPPSNLSLRSGRLVLDFLNGVTMTVEGPTDLDLISLNQVFCRWGKLRARVPKGAEGFRVLSPEAAVVDLGTEFAFNVEADGKSRVRVFEGRAEVALLDASGFLQRTQLVEQGKEYLLDPAAGRIAESAAGTGRFASAPVLHAPSLRLDPGYAEAILRSRPQGYWRFESLDQGLVPNELTNGVRLQAHGQIGLAAGPHGNSHAVFPAGAREQFLTNDGLWNISRESGHAVELWFMADRIRRASLLAFYPTTDPILDRGFIRYVNLMSLETTAGGRRSLDKPASIRMLRRWPPDLGTRPDPHAENPYQMLKALGRRRGSTAEEPSSAWSLQGRPLDEKVAASIFSRGNYVPGRWYHVVAQKQGDRIDLYVNGVRDFSMTLEPDHPVSFCKLVVGRSTAEGPDQLDSDPFFGGMDELAIYDHPLSPEEIRSHFEMGHPAPPP